MLDITIKIDGADAIRNRLREIASRAGNLSPIMKAIGDRVVAQTRERFKSGGPAPDGTPWKPPATPNPKRVRTLTVSGHLAGSIRYQLKDKNSVRIGTNRVYAAIHQLGGKTAPRVIRPVRKRALKTPFGLFAKINHPGSNIPARPYLGLSQANSDSIIRMIDEWVLRAGRRAEG